MIASISPLALLLVLVCPLMMIFMMRGGHGHGGHSHGMHGGGQQDADDSGQKQVSLQELRRRHDELAAQIQALEEQNRDRPATPTAQIESLEEQNGDRLATPR